MEICHNFNRKDATLVACKKVLPVATQTVNQHKGDNTGDGGILFACQLSNIKILCRQKLIPLLKKIIRDVNQ